MGFPACVEVRSTPPELQELSIDSHKTTVMLNHAIQHRPPIYFTREMFEEELLAALHYGEHSSAMKEVEFVYQEL